MSRDTDRPKAEVTLKAAREGDGERMVVLLHEAEPYAEAAACPTFRTSVGRFLSD